MADRSAHLPGRLSNPDLGLENDPRADPRIIAAMAAVGFEPMVEPLPADASYEQALEHCAKFEEVAAQGNAALEAMMPDFPSVRTRTETITGVDGNPIELLIHEPKERSGPTPCIVHTHGGGMVLMSAKDPMFVRLRNDLAANGLIVIGVEFRNGGGKLGNHPFPAGLNDCASGAQWAHENRDALGISKIVISGESGGGNLSIATALKAKKEGRGEQIDGVFAMCPYIFGGYASPPDSLLSLYENDGYTLSCEQMASLVKVYDPTGEHATNPLAWPYHAKDADLAGLPPHVISVNELDPLRDEGLAFYRKLLAAGVPAVARTVHGTPHAGDLSMPDVTPDIYGSTVQAIRSFARSL